MRNKAIYLIFLSVLSIFGINKVYGTTPISIKCVKTITKTHSHLIALCSQSGDEAYDDYPGDYYGRYKGSTCMWKHSSSEGEAGTSDANIEMCDEYALYIGEDKIDTIEKFIEHVPATELVKLYDPNMVN